PEHPVPVPFRAQPFRVGLPHEGVDDARDRDRRCAFLRRRPVLGIERADPRGRGGIVVAELYMEIADKMHVGALAPVEPPVVEFLYLRAPLVADAAAQKEAVPG